MKRRAGRTKKARLAVSAPVLSASQKARIRALEALARMRREGLSLTAAAEKESTTARTVIKYVGTAFHKKFSGRYQAKPFDRFARRLRFLSPEGQIPITVRSSRTASRIGEYWAAVHHYLRTGNTSRLSEFKGKSVRVRKNEFPFITEPKLLNQIASAGEVTFEDIYATTA